MMRKQIAGTMLVTGLMAWLVAAGLLIAAQPEWPAWAIWVLAMPALIVMCAFVAGPSRRVPDETKTINITMNNPVKPRFGEMKGENE